MTYDVLHVPFLIVAALIFKRIPLINLPLSWMEVFFHELSHGLAAILTFGWIHRINLHFMGGGTCTTKGGWRIPILLAGYTGAVLWGGFIFLAGWVLDTQTALALFYFLLGTLVISTVLWVRSLQTLIIMIFMGAVFYLPSLFPDFSWWPQVMEFIGIYIILGAIRAPLNLIDGKHVGDGAALADITLIPEGVWIALWFIFALFVLFFLWQLTVPTEYQFLLRLMA